MPKAYKDMGISSRKMEVMTNEILDRIRSHSGPFSGSVGVQPSVRNVYERSARTQPASITI